MKHFTTLVFAFSWFSALSQIPRLEWQNPAPNGNTLYSVQFVNDQVGYSVGEQGTILKTTNAGNSWTSQLIPFSEPLNGVSFAGPHFGLAVGVRGAVFRTTSGGSSWNNIIADNNSDLMAVATPTIQVAYMASNRGVILKSSNSGVDWVVQQTGVTTSIFSIDFLDVNHGWACGAEGVILKTTNGGTTWQRLSSGVQAQLNHIKMADNQVGWSCGNNGIILKTTNGGNTWQQQRTDISNALHAVRFSDLRQGVAVGHAGTILTTTNGGTNWSQVVSNTSNILYDFAFLTNQKIWAVGLRGTMIESRNSGRNWVPFNERVEVLLSDVDFVDDNHGYAVGLGGTLLKTNNGGAVWQSLTNIPNNPWITSVSFANRNTGWITTQDQKIYKTFDGGNAWQLQLSTFDGASSLTNRFIMSQDSLNIWACGDRGGVMYSNNSGASWRPKSSNGFNFNSLFTFEDGLCLVVGDRGTVSEFSAHRDDSRNLATGVSSDLLGIDFPNDFAGWAVGVNGTILKSTNRGNTWTAQISQTTEQLNAVKFFDQFAGIVVGNNGIMLYTVDGGDNWVKIPNKTNNNLRAIASGDSLGIWIVGDWGTILSNNISIRPSVQIPFSTISGKVYRTTPGNCGNMLSPIPGTLVMATGLYTGISREDGTYNIRVPIDTTIDNQVDVQAIISPSFGSVRNPVCPIDNAYRIRIGNTPQTVNDINFGQIVVPCQHLKVDYTSSFRRRCFTNTSRLFVQNIGMLAASEAYAILTYPKYVKLRRASMPFETINDSTYRFNFGTIGPNGQILVNLVDSVLCDDISILGRMQCTRVQIFPAPDCPSNDQWSGAELSLSGKCIPGGFVRLSLRNLTFANMPEPRIYSIYLDSMLLRTGVVQLNAGDSIVFEVENTGLDVHLEAEQVAHHPREQSLSLTVSGCVASTTPGRSVANKFPRFLPPNESVSCMPIIGAYDPNDKQVFPEGFTDKKVVMPNTRLEYLIRFQNTGSDTAFTVYIIDSLDAKLDVATFEQINSSHTNSLDIKTTLEGKTYLRWQFDNILLPDSNVNEPESHGFVKFRISPKKGLPLGTSVRNWVDIYFDFNPPITTNSTLTTFDLFRFTDPSLHGKIREVTPLRYHHAGRWINPNPVSNKQITLQFPDWSSFAMYDVTGRQIIFMPQLKGSYTIPINISKGMYIGKITNAAGSWSEKVVVE